MCYDRLVEREAGSTLSGEKWQLGVLLNHKRFI
jgi:hypothetical protein